MWELVWERQIKLNNLARKNNYLPQVIGGGGGIRTHGTLSRTPVFKTGAFDHSATPPSRVVDGF